MVEGGERRGADAERQRWQRQEPPPDLVEAVRHFNTGHYQGCTRRLALLWNRERGPLRFFYRGLAQAAAGLFHAARRNPHGSRVKLASAIHYLRQYEPSCLRIDVSRLVRELEHVQATTDRPGAVAADECQAITFPCIHWIEPATS